MKAGFIVFENIVINVENISWARANKEPMFYDSDKPYTMRVTFKGVDEFIPFNYKTQAEAHRALQDFINLMQESLQETR